MAHSVHSRLSRGRGLLAIFVPLSAGPRSTLPTRAECLLDTFRDGEGTFQPPPRSIHFCTGDRKNHAIWQRNNT
jgi:hypothetical protein